MKVKDIRGQSLEQLRSKLVEQLEEQFKYRIQHSTGQLVQSHLLKESRRNIARIKTLIKESVGG